MNKEVGKKQGGEKLSVTVLDFKIAVAAGICFVIAVLLKKVGFVFSYHGMELEILQKMTACIGCFLCVQDTVKPSIKAGVNRLIITAIGGAVAIVIILIDDVAANDWLMAAMVFGGIVATLFLCKAAKVPYINARIGCVTLVLVSCTLSSSARIWYAVFRLLSTLFAVLVVMLVTWIFDRVAMKRSKETI